MCPRSASTLQASLFCNQTILLEHWSPAADFVITLFCSELLQSLNSETLSNKCHKQLLQLSQSVLAPRERFFYTCDLIRWTGTYKFGGNSYLKNQFISSYEKRVLVYSLLSLWNCVSQNKVYFSLIAGNRTLFKRLSLSLKITCFCIFSKLLFPFSFLLVQALILTYFS